MTSQKSMKPEQQGLHWPVPLLRLLADHDHVGELVIGRADDGTLTYSVNVSDVFANGCADAEPVDVQDLPALQTAFADAAACATSVGGIKGVSYAEALYASRRRKQCPQGIIITDEVAPLFGLSPKPKPQQCDYCGKTRQDHSAEGYCRQWSWSAPGAR